MLTIATINPKQAEEYYQQENYYSKNAALENSEWWGRGAETLGLSGAISDNEVYKNLVNGLSPDGKQALRGKPKGASQEKTQASSQSEQNKKQGKHKQSKKQKKQSEERAGVDMTFSAPKSVSLACLVGGDKRLEEAHRQAVKRTLEFTEKHYPQTRIKKQRVETDNLTVAMWHHDTSRELDPHLHTHCVLMNFTQLPDGRWQSRTDENLYYNKMLLGQIYRQELALECRKLGYEIEPQPKELFEIKGYTREQIEAFSKRHEQIVKYLEGREIDVTTESKVWAWRRTRVKKNHEMGRNEKLPYWHEEADLYGIVHPNPVQELQTATATVTDIDVEKELTTAVSTAIEHCSERKVAFKQEEILEFVTTEVKPFGINELEKAISSHPELIKTFDGRYTTQSALTRELATIDLMQQGKGILNPITHPDAVEHYLENKTLTQGQREAVTVAATTTDQFIAWQGVAGAGKTYALNQLKQVTTALSDVAPDYVIKGFAPSAAAAKVLEDELGIEANTVARLLVSKQSEQVQPNQIWIVDEAGLLSAKAAHELLQRATEERARVILVGDTRQLSAIEAGNPFKSLQQAGIQTAHLDESLRQKAPDLQKAVNLAAAGQMSDAIAHLEQVGRIEEIADVKERTTKIAAQYIKLLPQERQNTLILAGTHKEQSSIVKEIRGALKQEGTIGYGVEATTLKALNLTSVQARYTHNYSVGDVVVPIREYRRSGLHKSQPYIVKAKSQDKLILSDEAGNHLTVDPMKFRKTVYQQETNEIAVGDRLRWTRNDKELGRRNGQEFLVTGIEGQTAFIQYCDGKTDSINLSQPLHCDYALVTTTYSSQGKTAERVLVSSTIDRTVSQESLYVAVSRAKHDLQIFAEDRSFLFEQAQKSNAQETVLELLQHQSKQQTPQQPAPDVNQAVESSSVATPVKPKAKRDFPSPIPTGEIRLSKPVTSPVKRSDQKPNEVKVPNLPVRFSAPHRPIQKPVEPFWIPDSSAEAPPHIEEKQWCELVEGSAIHPAIAARNFRSLEMGSIEQEHEAWEYLMYSDKLERTNTGRLAGGMLNRYAHIEAGGWWCSAGVDSRSFNDLQTSQKPKEKIWGCYKPNAPRENVDKPGKKIKYEHPPKTDLGIFLLDVPDDIANRIYEKAGVNPSDSDRASGFWYCVWKHNLPITITEGAKKAASLLSQGHAAIGLPGIYAGYRSKDEHGNPIKAHLHEELAVFATPEREIRFCFDFETKPETKRNIEIAISRTGSLLKQKQSHVSVVSLPGSEKGVDDLIAAIGPLAYEQQHAKALPLQEWRTRNKQQQTAIEPPKVLSVESRKLRIKAKLTLGQPINDRDFNKPEGQTHDNKCQQLETERAAEQRSFIRSDRFFDTERGRPESSERGSYTGEQKLAGGYEEAIEHHSVDSEGDVKRLHRSVQASFGGTEIGQNERIAQFLERGNEQSLGQARQYEHGTASGQRASDVSLRRNYGQEDANSAQRTEAAAHVIGEWSDDGQWAVALTDLAQLVQSVNDEQLIRESGLTVKLAALTQRIAELNNEPRQYQFKGLSELARALTIQEAENNLVERLTQIQATQIQVNQVLDEVMDASALIDELRPETEQLVQAILNLQSAQEVSAAIAKVSEVVQQLEQGQAFDFGDLAEVLNSVNYEQLLSEKGLDTKLIALTQQLSKFTDKVLTQFAGMSGLVTTLQSVQAESQLKDMGLVDQVAALTALLERLDSEPRQHKFEGITEIAQMFNSVSIEHLLTETGLDTKLVALTQQLSEFTAKAPTQFEGMSKLATTLQSVQAESQLVENGLIDQVAAFTKQLAYLNNEPEQYKFEGMTEIAQMLSQHQTQISLCDTLSEIAELALKLDRQDALASLAQTVRSFNAEQQFQNSGLLERLQAMSERITALNAPMINFAPPQKLTNTPTVNQDKLEAFKANANSVRDMPLEEVAERLNLERDLHDKHKWKGVGQTISINDQKFYDHLALKGGYGAIDLVMHVQGRNFKESVDWLSNGISELSLPQQRLPQPKIPQERQPFQPPVPDESKWQEVRQYLLEQRGLPAKLVDKLHSSGKIYAAGLEPETIEKLCFKGYSHPENIKNAVFLRHNLDQEPTGASLRGVSDNSSFKGLATGSHRDDGWFSFIQGSGRLERIVLVESAIDALSAAALAKHPGCTMFMSTDGAGSVPVNWLQQQQAQGIQIIAAHDADCAGEEMAWRLATDVPAISRATPTRGKDWNEKLLSDIQLVQPENSLDISEWQRVAQAIGKPVAYINRIKAVTEAGLVLPEQAFAAMQHDFHAYKQTTTDLWQWYQVAKILGESESDLKQITEVAIAFHHPHQPIPIAADAVAKMQQDFKNHQRLEKVEMLSRLSDQDFVQLHQDVSNYFTSAPPSPPAVIDRQVIQGEVEQLQAQINHLWQLQTQQSALVESMQKNPFQMWGKKYDPALAQVQETTSLISSSIAQKEQKEQQLKQWEKLDEVYQAWERNPLTTKMRSFSEVFNLPAIQQRFTQIKQELQRQKALKANRQQQSFNQHQNKQQGRGRSL